MPWERRRGSVIQTAQSGTAKEEKPDIDRRNPASGSLRLSTFNLQLSTFRGSGATREKK
jgi:hypothetical protein